MTTNKMNADFDALLAAARQGDVNAQKRVLIALNAIFDERREFYNLFNRLNNDDAQWITALAQQLYVPALKVLYTGMKTNRVLKISGPVYHSNSKIYYFTPDQDLLHRLDEAIYHQIETMPTGELLELFTTHEPLSELRIWYYDFEQSWFKAMWELYDRGVSFAAKELGDMYRDGRESCGIFIDYKKAKQFYDEAHEEFNIDQCLKEYADGSCLRHEPIVDSTLSIKGASAAVVKHLIQDINQQLGENSATCMRTPLERVMQVLVGSPYYPGHITAVNEVSPNEIEVKVTCHECNTSALKFALLECFDDLDINLKKEEQ